MVFQKTTELRDGRICVMRNACEDDAWELIEYLKTTAGETDFLLSNPEEIKLTVEQETAFIKRIKDSKKDLMVLAKVDGELAGTCSAFAVGNRERYGHRCSIAIALYQKYWGAGIGRILLNAVLEAAKECGYEQAELEVVTANERAVSLYKSLGFEICGTKKHGMKYKDGSYGDEFLMMKSLK